MRSGGPSVQNPFSRRPVEVPGLAVLRRPVRSATLSPAMSHRAVSFLAGTKCDAVTGHVAPCCQLPRRHEVRRCHRPCRTVLSASSLTRSVTLSPAMSHRAVSFLAGTKCDGHRPCRTVLSAFSPAQSATLSPAMSHRAVSFLAGTKCDAVTGHVAPYCQLSRRHEVRRCHRPCRTVLSAFSPTRSATLSPAMSHHAVSFLAGTKCDAVTGNVVPCCQLSRRHEVRRCHRPCRTVLSAFLPARSATLSPAMLHRAVSFLADTKCDAVTGHVAPCCQLSRWHEVRRCHRPCRTVLSAFSLARSTTLSPAMSHRAVSFLAGTKCDAVTGHVAPCCQLPRRHEVRRCHRPCHTVLSASSPAQSATLSPAMSHRAVSFLADTKCDAFFQRALCSHHAHSGISNETKNIWNERIENLKATINRCPTTHRTRRGLLNIIGTLSNTLFGTATED